MNKAETGFSAQALRQLLGDRLGEHVSLKVAYSGGVDSHVLLHALRELHAALHWPVSALHVDHGLESDSRKWAHHCLRVCKELEIPCTIERIEVKGIDQEGREAAARRMRYARLARHIGAGDVLLTAHHLDDQAETVLLQLVRGSGVRGLAAMPELVKFSGGKLMRPLLRFTRVELTAYARAHGLQWIEDSSNRDLRYARNFIRHQLLPVIEQRWPQAKRMLARSGRHATEASILLDVLALNDLEACEPPAARDLSVPAVSQLPPERRRNLLRFWIRQHGFVAPSTLLIQSLDRVVTQSTRSHQAVLVWPGAEVRRYRDRLSIMAPLSDPNPSLNISWNPAVPLQVPGTGYLLRSVATVGKGLSKDSIGSEALSVRLRQGGETCRLPGRRHHHKLKKLFQEAGVPPWERGRLPLIYVGERLAAVAGRWVFEPFAAGEGEPSLQVVLEKADSGASPVRD